jgi:uncharacterized protein YjbJ (UPF0337 family)
MGSMREDTDKAMRDAKNSAAADKAKGHAKEFAGTVKEKVGRAIGDDELEAKGYAQNAEGKVDRAKGEIKEKVEDVKSKVKAGAEIVKEKVDELRNRH